MSTGNGIAIAGIWFGSAILGVGGAFASSPEIAALAVLSVVACAFFATVVVVCK